RRRLLISSTPFRIGSPALCLVGTATMAFSTLDPTPISSVGRDLGRADSKNPEKSDHATPSFDRVGTADAFLHRRLWIRYTRSHYRIDRGSTSRLCARA